MNMRAPSTNLIGVGPYTVGDAARLLRTPAKTVRGWLAGYEYRRGGERRHAAPLWEPDLQHPEDGVELSFRDLIELRFVRAFTGIGLDLRTVRACLEAARSAIDSDRPFSSGRFRTDGKRIFLELTRGTDDPALLDLKNRQYVSPKIIEQTFRDLDLEDDLVVRWRPWKGKGSIVIDPYRSCGQPVAAAFGVPRRSGGAVRGAGKPGRGQRLAPAMGALAQAVRLCRDGRRADLGLGRGRRQAARTSLPPPEQDLHLRPRRNRLDAGGRGSLQRTGP
ncbi:MAG: hypothetical protein ACXIUV_04080 [Alkalilacustris sp.]